MAYLTQYSNSVPFVKYHIDQSLMTIGQNIDMDICVPEDGVKENHAAVVTFKSEDSYRFIIKSQENEPQLELNGEATSYAELEDGDWVLIGGIEFKFTDDGVNSIIADTVDQEVEVAPAIIEKPILVSNPPPVKTENNESEALTLIRELKEDLQDVAKPLTTKEFIANSRQSRRRLAF